MPCHAVPLLVSSGRGVLLSGLFALSFPSYFFHNGWQSVLVTNLIIRLPTYVSTKAPTLRYGTVLCDSGVLSVDPAEDMTTPDP